MPGTIRSTIRRRVGSAVGGGGGGEEASYLLDTYTDARVAYSVRQLRADQTYAMKVRRFSGNAEQDIGFDANGDLDVAAIETFCDGDDGWVSVWYDQSGNGNDVSNSLTYQPQIVSAGSVMLEGTVPKLQFDGYDDSLNCSGVTIGLQTRSWSVVCKQDSAANDKGVISFKPAGLGNDWASADSFVFSSQNTSLNRHFTLDGDSGYNVQKNGPAAVPHGHFWEEFASGSGEFFHDGTSIGTDTGSFSASNSTQFLVGLRWQGGYMNNWNGSIQEVIYWDADKSSDRTAIHDDVQAYFGTP
jgi:hypothetical protein